MSHWLIKCLYCLSMLYVSHALACSIEGIWHGTLGSQMITLQLHSTEWDKQSTGIYFYDQSGEPLYLKHDLQKDVWIEQTMTRKMTGTISAFKCKDEALTANWHSLNQQQNFAIKAERTDKFESQWQIPIIADKKTYYFEQHPYSILKSKHIDSYTIQLEDTSTGAQIINKKLKSNMRESLNEHLQCFISYFGKGSALSQTKIIDWNSDYLVLSEYFDSDCGGAHPNSGTEYKMYSLKSGLQLETNHWFKSQYLIDEKYDLGFKEIDPNKALGKMLRKKYRHQLDNELIGCEDTVSFYNETAWATKEGVHFAASASPYSAKICEAEVLIPYQLITPFLTHAGKHAIKPFLEKP